jgi:RimJ/RimL family protein N-acetyltransferase
MSGHYATKLVLRPATLRDADLLLAWRNDPGTQKASLHQTEIQADKHLRWLSKKLNNPDLRLLIAEKDGIPAGTVRAEFSDGVWELSWTMAPEHRGSGIGKQMVARLARQLPGPSQAKVKSDNPASASIAAHVGMTLDRETDGILYYSRPG